MKRCLCDSGEKQRLRHACCIFLASLPRVLQLTEKENSLMASNLPSFDTLSTNQNRPINIVPLYVPGPVKPAAPAAQLVYNNGPLLTTVQVFTIFWGTAWQQSPASDTLQSLNGFFDFILTSPL